MFHSSRRAAASLLAALACTAQAQLLSPDSQRPVNANTAARNNGLTQSTGSMTGNLGALAERTPNASGTALEGALPTLNGVGLGSQAGPREDDLPAALTKGASERSRSRERSTEFSRYASKLTGQTLKVYGADFFARLLPAGATSNPVVPPDYAVNAGDELLIQVSGTVDAEIRQQVRRGGDITLPRIGAFRVAGVPAGELAAVIRRRLETQFRDIQVSVSFVALRGMRVFVTGFVETPGPQVVDSLATMTTAIAAAGGPAEGGSHRVVDLWRSNRKLASFDLYRFLVLGDNSGDVNLTAGDVVRVAPASRFQVALTGSVNRPGVYEMLPGETFDDLLLYAGGFTPVADRQRLAAVEIDANGLRQVNESRLVDQAPVALKAGSVLHVFSGATLNQGSNSTAKIVHVEGEVRQPGAYVLRADSTLTDAIQAAGGLTAEANARGLTLTRPTLAREQEEQYQRSLDELERSMFETYLKNNSSLGEAVQASFSQVQSATRNYIDRLRQFKPTGRLIMGRISDSPPVLQNGDRIDVPAQSTSISVFGAVYGEGSYRVQGALPLETVLAAAGGVRDGADADGIIVLKADGSFQPLPRKPIFGSRSAQIEPGDTVLVPTDTDRPRFWAMAKDVGTLLYQFGLGAAAIKALN